MVKKPLIKSTSSITDSIWFKFEPTLETARQIYRIFQLDEYGLKYKKYSEIVPWSTSIEPREDFDTEKMIFIKKDYLAYLIFANKHVHLILRKKGMWKNIRDQILESFDFQKAKR